MVGLLIADWRRRKFRAPVLYACPTQQLAHQVCAVAEREGIPAVTLVGSAKRWPANEHMAYEASDKLAITTYKSIFNAAPKVGAPGTIVFDDAHAAEQYVAESWAVVVDRSEQPAAYAALLAAVRPALSGMFHQRMEQSSPDLRDRADVRLVVPLRRPRMVESVAAALHVLNEGSNAWWAASAVRPGLPSCLIYVSWRQILVRPFIPPTTENEPFEGADQRVYLSATPGHAGELERAFGRGSIDRLLLPDGRSPRSGRRFFVFTDLTDGDSDAVSAEVTRAAGKALVLGTSTERARKAAATLNPHGWPVLGKDDLEANLQAFSQSTNAILALAGRYDGIDLPDDACRLVCLSGLPDWAHLQENFMSSTLRARAALEERTRTRVVQGAGRATRNPLDHAIVMVTGHDLTRYLSSPIVRSALDVDLQAEIEFGLENSREESEEGLLLNVSIFLQQGNEWRDSAEPMIADARRKMSRSDPPGSAQLANAAPHEVEACASAFRSDFVGARDAAQRAAVALSGEEAVRPYRALWLYLAATWSFAAAGTDPNAGKTGAGLLERASKAASGTTWLREAEAGAPSAVEEDADDTPAVKAIARRLAEGVKRKEINAAITRMNDGIGEIDHRKSEPALVELGRLLGAESCKPPGQGRADAAWCWGERIWIGLEAKSEQSADGEITLRDVRQANTQLDQLADDRGVGRPSLAADVIISPRTRVADEAVTAANPEVFLVQPAAVRELADSIVQCWDKLLLTSHGHTGRDLEALVRKTLAEGNALPTQAFERLTAAPVAV